MNIVKDLLFAVLIIVIAAAAFAGAWAFLAGAATLVWSIMIYNACRNVEIIRDHVASQTREAQKTNLLLTALVNGDTTPEAAEKPAISRPSNGQSQIGPRRVIRPANAAQA